MKTIERMRGMTFISIKQSDDTMVFIADDTTEFIFNHEQDCCESVGIHEVVGDLNDLLNSPMLQAEESTNEEDDQEKYESATWTFYRFATIKGAVTISWLGESNGYYSESVNINVKEPDLIDYAKKVWKSRS